MILKKKDILTRYRNWCARTEVINGQTKIAGVCIQQQVVDEVTLVVVYLGIDKRLGRKTMRAYRPMNLSIWYQAICRRINCNLTSTRRVVHRLQVSAGRCLMQCSSIGRKVVQL